MPFFHGSFGCFSLSQTNYGTHWAATAREGPFSFLWRNFPTPPTLLAVLETRRGLCLWITAVASRPGRRHHLRWIEPVTVSALLAVCNRALIDLGLLFPGPSPNGFLRPLLLYGADLTSLYGGVMLWRVLRERGAGEP